MKEPVNVAVVQHPPVFLNINESLKLADRYIRKAAGEHADVIVFPETWLPGYPVWLDYAPGAGLWDHPPANALYRLLVKNSVQLGDEHCRKLQQTATETGCLIVMGAHELVGRTLYNSILYFSGDKEVIVHRKLMPTYTERLIWGMGDGSTLTVTEHKEAVIGGLICWEHWMPLARAAMYTKGEDIHIAQWPMVEELHQIASRHYAFEGQCYVVAAGCTLTKQQAIDGARSVVQTTDDKTAITLLEEIDMPADNHVLRGGSCVISPDTKFILEPQFDRSDIFHVWLDQERLTEGNLFMDTDGHYSRPDIFKLNVDTKPKTNVTFEDE